MAPASLSGFQNRVPEKGGAVLGQCKNFVVIDSINQKVTWMQADRSGLGRFGGLGNRESDRKKFQPWN